MHKKGITLVLQSKTASFPFSPFCREPIPHIAAEDAGIIDDFSRIP